MQKRLKFIEQMQQTECGLCCAGMLMNYYGYDISISSLRAENDIGRDGSSLLQVKNILKIGRRSSFFMICSVTKKFLFTNSMIRSYYTILPILRKKS